MIVGVLLPRFALTVAAGGREGLLRRPAALAPEAGREPDVGEVSLAAEAFGVRPGMRLGEVLARCPGITLIPPDPAGVADAWERLLAGLEGMGAAVEGLRPGLACFAAPGLVRLHGGSVEGVLGAARRALGTPARLGVAPTRFCAVAAATRARPRRPEVVRGGAAAYLAPLPVGLLRAREETAALPPVLERLGVDTLGALAGLSPAAVADRLGAAGVLAHRLASGHDEPLRPREPLERLEESLDLPEAVSGLQLERGLALLVDRVLARRERRGRTLRAVVLAARLVEGGTWRERVTFREALADPGRMRLALGPRLALLPAPAEALRLTVERFGPPVGDQRSLLDEAAELRAARLREGVRQARAAAGPEAALRVLAVDPGSRVPERRTALAPFEE
jgi:nucleotidyltransferase/DNA polymerase involved in DNA repair